MLIATLRTRIIEDQKFLHEPVEGGFFEQEVRVPKDKLTKSGDVRGLAMYTISLYLASAVSDTGVPQDKWTCEFAPGLRKMITLPEFVAFDGEPL